VEDLSRDLSQERLNVAALRSALTAGHTTRVRQVNDAVVSMLRAVGQQAQQRCSLGARFTRRASVAASLPLTARAAQPYAM